MALPNNNITTQLVKNTIGSMSNNVGVLCTSLNINEWSKWKPIKANATTLTNEILEQNNYGIGILSATTPNTLFSLVANNLRKGYKYNMPQGGETSPFRLGDFRNYTHIAEVPILNFYSDDDVVEIGNVASDYSVEISTKETLNDTYGIMPSDIYPTDATHRGVYFTNKDKTIQLWCTTSIPFGLPQFQQLKGQTIYAMEFLTNVGANTNSLVHTSTSDDIFCAIPHSIHTITVSEDTPSGSRKLCVKINQLCYFSTTKKITYSFYFSSIGDIYSGGTINNIWYGIYSNSECTNAIAINKLSDSLTLGEETTSDIYSGTYTINEDYTTLYFGIYYDSALQLSRTIMMISTDDNGNEFIKDDDLIIT